MNLPGYNIRQERKELYFQFEKKRGKKVKQEGEHGLRVTRRGNEMQRVLVSVEFDLENTTSQRKEGKKAAKAIARLVTSSSRYPAH